LAGGYKLHQLEGFEIAPNESPGRVTGADEPTISAPDGIGMAG
jgi:hypothetical protein